MELSAQAVRVLGCLMEKERTVPDTYPMTLNALVSACNQSTNRVPVVSYEPSLVQRTLDTLKEDGLVRFVHPSHGERTTKFRQVLDEKLGLAPDETAVLCVLFVRGPQTVAELRARTERLHDFSSTADIERTLDALAARDEPFVRRVARRAGEREERWTHLLAPVAPVDEEVARVAEPPPSSQAPAAPSSLEARVAALEASVAHLLSILGEEGPPPTV